MAATVGGLLIIVAILSQFIRPAGVVMHGSLFVSDAGRSHGGFEYNAEWNATLTVEGTSGVLRLVLKVGLSDALQKHEYRLTDFTRNATTISMRIDSQYLVLVWQDFDPVWNHTYDRYYVASWGSDAPPEEIRGTILPILFPGLVEHYYVELRLR